MAKIKAGLLHRAMNYTIDEFAALQGMTASAARVALKKAPDALTETKPILVIGRILKDQLLSEARQRRTVPMLQPAEFRCTKCKMRVPPAENLVEVRPGNGPKLRRLEAFCGNCGGMISKFVRQDQLPEIEQALGIELVD